MRRFASFVHAPSFLALLAALMAAVLAPEPALATLVAELSLDELSAQADAVVHGRVTRVGSRTMPVHGRPMPVQIVVIAVQEWLVGQGGHEVIVREVGGTSAGTTVTREGTPVYRRGEEVVVFLRHDGEAYTTLGLAQGHFRIVGDASHGRFVERDLEGLVLVERERTATRARSHASEARSEAEAFLADVRRRTRTRRSR